MTGRMLDRRKWTSLPMPAEVTAQINTLARARPSGLHFTNMWNEAYADTTNTYSDDDSDYSDDTSTEDEDYDDFITGVDLNNNPHPPPDPPVTNANETRHNLIDDDDDNDTPNINEDEDADDADTSDDGSKESDNACDNIDDASDTGSDDTITLSMALKKLTDNTGALLLVIHSWTRQQEGRLAKALPWVPPPKNGTRSHRPTRNSERP